MSLLLLRWFRMIMKARYSTVGILVAFALASILGSFAIALMISSIHFDGAAAAAAASEQSTGTHVSIVPGASTLTDKAYSPNPVNVKVGGTVTWTNDDSMSHRVTSRTGLSDLNKGKEFDSGLLTPKGKHLITYLRWQENLRTYVNHINPNNIINYI